ncbi:KamA family radical SAM protein [Thermophagus sp. OGC60D27]|uniref:KamA family radical SAM protein n=1 Tax=Thermophagus sp. OGC60D27 TaxID=3458415 RepID=UPI00403847FD
MKFITYNARNFREIEYMRYLPEKVKKEIDIVSKVIPFKTNNYVVDYLIDWENFEDDPIFILNFPNKQMLTNDQYRRLVKVLNNPSGIKEANKIIHDIRMEMNPHPAQQMTNVPTMDGEELKGMQHKYKDIVLFFPSQGQTCHAHCTFCFRWPQFIKDLDLKFSMREIQKVIKYIRQNESINEILFTGGDPMVMDPATIKNYIDALIDAQIPNLQNIRFGTKSLSYWPFTFLPKHNEEATQILDILKHITDSGLHLSIMAHFNHPNELDTEVVQEAIRNIRATGAEIRTQAPVLNHINNRSEDWARMWKKQVQLGLVPYYMFIERETGPYNYFSLPLVDIYKMYQKAMRETGSFAKTVTGPVMSASKGKVQIMGIVTNPLDGSKYFMMQYIRHRNYSETFKPFLMHYDKQATWVDQLKEVEIPELIPG